MRDREPIPGFVGIVALLGLLLACLCVLHVYRSVLPSGQISAQPETSSVPIEDPPVITPEILALARSHGMPPEAERYQSMIRSWAAFEPAIVHRPGDGQIGSPERLDGPQLSPEWVRLNRCTASRAEVITQPEVRRAELVSPRVERATLVKMP
jgi:hypothetical protein